MQERKLCLQGRISRATLNKLGILFHKQIFSKSTSLDQFAHKFTFALSTCNKFVWNTVNCMHGCHKQLQVYSLICWFIYMVFSEELDLYRTRKKWKANWIEFFAKGIGFIISTRCNSVQLTSWKQLSFQLIYNDLRVELNL